MTRFATALALLLALAVPLGAQTTTTLPFCTTPQSNSCISLATFTTTTSTTTTSTSTTVSTSTSSSLATTSSSTSTSTSTVTTTSTSLVGGNFARGFGSSATDAVYGVATDAGGNAFVAGNFSGSVPMGGSTLTSAGSADGFLAKYSNANALMWAVSFGGSGNEAVTGMAYDPATVDLVVVGTFSGTATFGACGAKTATGTQSAYIAEYDAATGACQWVVVTTDQSTRYSKPNAVAFDNAGNVYTTGEFTGTTSFGSTTLTPITGGFANPGTVDTFVWKLNHTGVHQWAKQFPNTGTDRGYGIAADANGVVVVGAFNNGMSFDGTTACPSPCQFVAGGTLARNDAFVVALNGSGVYRWAKQLGGVDLTDNLYAAAIDGSSNVYVGGSFGSASMASTDLGCGSPIAHLGANDAVLVSYQSNGTARWCKRFGSTSNNDYLYGLAVSGSTVIAGGMFGGTADFGGTSKTSIADSNDAYVARYATANGALQSVAQFGGSGDDQAKAVSAGPTSGGYFTSATAQFPVGGITLTNQGLADGFVSRNP